MKRNRYKYPVTLTAVIGFKDKNWTKGQAVCVLNQSGPRCGPINPRLSLGSAKELEEILPRRSQGLAVSVQPQHQTAASSEGLKGQGIEGNGMRPIALLSPE